MSLLFAHDTKFKKVNNEYYNTGSFSAEVFKRYTKIFKKVTVVSRQVDLEISNENPDMLTLSSAENIEFVKIPNINSFKIFTNYTKAYKLIEEQVVKSDYVIARLPSIIGSIAVNIAKKYNKKYLIEVVGCSWDTFSNIDSVLGKALAPLLFTLQKKQIKNAPYVSYITKEFLQKRYPTDGFSEVLPNVIIHEVDRKVLTNRIYKINNMKNNIKFGLIGSLDVDYKGHETVLKSLAILKNKIPNFNIEFLGGGDPTPWIDLSKKLNIRENVIFKGTLSNGEDVFNWLDSLDIQLQPSLAEAQGRSIIEGMSRGCPIISSEVGGVNELLDKNFLIEPKDEKKLSQLILKMLDTETMKKQAVKNFEHSKIYYFDKIEKNRNYFYNFFKG